MATKDFELLQDQTVSKHAKVTKIFKILFLASKTIEISLVPLCFHVYGMTSAKQWQIINKILIFHQIFCEMGGKNVAKLGVFPQKCCQIRGFLCSKKTKKMKKLPKSGCCQNRGFPKSGFDCNWAGADRLGLGRLAKHQKHIFHAEENLLKNYVDFGLKFFQN